jgi:TP901 family phage tail tape measure protein
MASSPTVNINGNLNINNASVKKSASQVQSAFNNIKINPQSLDKFGNSLGRITGNASEFQKSMDAATARVFAFGATAAVIQTINQSFKALLTSTIQVEKRLVEINSILGASEQQFSKFRKSIFDVAKNTEQSFSIVADGAAELARQGLSAEETAKRLNAALVLTRISGLDSVSSVNALTAAINGYTSAALNAEQIVNKLVAVDTAFAVSAKDLADGFQRAGSTAEDAGVSFDELLGLITAVQQKTARGGAVIGNAFKSIFTRLSRSTTISELQELGVAIDSSQSGVQKLEALSKSLSKISDPTQASKIKELAGGVFQINVVSAALKDLSSETSLFAQASDIAAKASNEAFAKNEALNKTLSTQINALVVGLTNVAEKVGQITLAPVISDLVSLANKLTSFLDNALSEDQGFSIIRGLFDGIGKFIQGPGLILITGAFLNIFKIVSKFAIQGFKDLSTLGSGQEKIRSIEQGIVSLLTQDVNLRKQLANASLSQSQKEQLVLNAIKRENALLREQQAIISSLAAASARRGVASFSPSGGFKGKRGKRFAAGYTPEDGMMEVMEAVSLGASPSVKPQMGQGTIGGKKFLMNSQEVELPNFGMNGDSAVIPLYASGHLPRFAGGARGARGAFDISTVPISQLRAFRSGGRLAGQAGIKDSQVKKELARREAAKAPTLLDPTGFPFMVPSKGAITPDLGTTKQTTIKDRVYRLSKPPSVYTPNLKNLDKVADPFDLQLEKNVTKGITDSSLKYAKLLDPPVKNQPTRRDVERNLNKGTVAAAVGVAFESAVTSALKLANPKNGRFDVADIDKQKELKELFNIRGAQKAGDFKNSTSRGNIQSFISKILSHPTNARLRGKKTGKGRRRASGFMPRFSRGFTGKKIKNVPTQNTQPRTPSSQPDLGGGGGVASTFNALGQGFTLSYALAQALSFVEQSNTAPLREEIRELNNALEDYQKKLDKIDEEADPKRFKQTSDAIESVNKKLRVANEELEDTSAKFNEFSNAVTVTAYLAPQATGPIKKLIAKAAPTIKNVAKGFRSPKAFGNLLRSPLTALTGGKAAGGLLGGKQLALRGGLATAGIFAADEVRKFTEDQITESLNSVSGEDFSKKAVITDFARKLNPVNAISDAINDEQATFGQKAKEIAMAVSPAAVVGKLFALAGFAAAKEEKGLPREQVLSKKVLDALERGDLREINTPEEAEAEVERLKRERKKRGPRKSPEKQTKTFGEFTDLSDLPTLSTTGATFRRIGFGGGLLGIQSQIAQMIESNQLNTNIKDLSDMEQVKQAKKRQAKDVRLKRLQSSIEFEDAIKVFNRAMKAPSGGKFAAGEVTGAGNIQEVEKARQTALDQASLSRVLSDAAVAFRQSSDPKTLADAFTIAGVEINDAFKSGAISEEQRDKFRSMLEANLEQQSSILAQDVIDRKKLAFDSLRARVQAEEDIVNKLKAAFESNLSKLDSKSSQVAVDFSQAKTRSERDQFLKNLGISDQGRFQAAVADTTTAQFGQAAVAGAGTELRDYIKSVREADPEGAAAIFEKKFSSGQKQVLSEALESSNIEGLKERLFGLEGAKTARGGYFTNAGVRGLINNVSSAGLGDISSIADAQRAINSLKAVSQNIGQLSGTKGQTEAQNEIGVQIASIIEKIEAGIGVANVAKFGIEEQQLEKLKTIAQNTADLITKQGLAKDGEAPQPPDSRTQPNPSRLDPASATAAQNAAKKRAEEEAEMGFSSGLSTYQKIRNAEEAAAKDRIASVKTLQDKADKAELDRLKSMKNSYKQQADTLKGGGEAVRDELDKIAESLMIVNKRMLELTGSPPPEAPPN